MRILVVRQDVLGDLIVSTPVFASLKLVLPEAHITALVRRSYRQVVEGNPYVDEVWGLPERFVEAYWLTTLAYRIWRSRFDAVVLLRRRSHLPSLICKLAGIPVRVGNAYRIYDRFHILTHNIGEHPLRFGWHEVEHVLHIAGQLVGEPLPPSPLLLPLDEQSVNRAQWLLGERGIKPGEGYVVVHPGSGGSARSWSPEGYAQFLRWLSRQTGWKAVVTGIRREYPLAQQICQLAGGFCVNLAGETSIRELGAVLRAARLYVGTDTGAMHVAAAMGTPCVVVYPASFYEPKMRMYHPWGVDYVIVPPSATCKGCTATECHRRGTECIRSITPEQVMEYTQSLLSRIEKNVLQEKPAGWGEGTPSGSG